MSSKYTKKMYHRLSEKQVMIHFFGQLESPQKPIAIGLCLKRQIFLFIFVQHLYQTLLTNTIYCVIINSHSQNVPRFWREVVKNG